MKYFRSETKKIATYYPIKKLDHDETTKLAKKLKTMPKKGV